MVSSTEQTIGALRQKAKEHGFRMADIAEYAGIHPAQLSRWATGKVIPLHSNIVKLEQAVNQMIAAKAHQ